MSECVTIIDEDAMVYATMLLCMVGAGVIGGLLWTVIERTLMHFGVLRRNRVTINISGDNFGTSQPAGGSDAA